MKAKILVIAKMNDGKNKSRSVTTLELSNRALTDEDIKKLYDKLNSRILFNYVTDLKVTLQLSENKNKFFSDTKEIHNKHELNKAITDYGMIIDYEYSQRI